jgi:hypothetical protein
MSTTPLLDVTPEFIDFVKKFTTYMDSATPLVLSIQYSVPTLYSGLFKLFLSSEDFNVDVDSDDTGNKVFSIRGSTYSVKRTNTYCFRWVTGRINYATKIIHERFEEWKKTKLPILDVDCALLIEFGGEFGLPYITARQEYEILEKCLLDLCKNNPYINYERYERYHSGFKVSCDEEKVLKRMKDTLQLNGIC